MAKSPLINMYNHVKIIPVLKNILQKVHRTFQILTNVVGVVRSLMSLWSIFNDMHEWVEVIRYFILRKFGKKLMHE